MARVQGFGRRDLGWVDAPGVPGGTIVMVRTPRGDEFAITLQDGKAATLLRGEIYEGSAIRRLLGPGATIEIEQEAPSR